MATVAHDLPKAAISERLSASAATARNWAICLVVVGLLFKVVWVVWCALDGALDLQAWEWVALPMLSSYQHLIFGFACFTLFFMLLLPSIWFRPLRTVALVLVGAGQVLAVMYFMTALRMALILGTPPTFGLLAAGAGGGVLGGSAVAPENAPYLVAGIIVAALTVAASFIVSRRWPGWPRRHHLALSGLVAGLWVTAGAMATGSAHSELHHAQTEPLSFFFFELFEERAERQGVAIDHNPEAFRVDLIHGEAEAEPTSRHFQNLEAFRRTRKNVVLIILESVPATSASYVGPVEVNGQSRETTPNIAALRENMLVMENHYAVHPTSMEDLFSINCSLYPYPLRPTITDVNPTIPCGSLPEMLVGAGYVAGLFHSGHFSFWHKERFFGGRGFEVMYDADTMPGREGAYEYNWGIDERVTARNIAEFIHANRNRSFFVEYIPVFPHSPYNVPSEEMVVFPGEERITGYHNSLRYVDGALATIFDALREDDLMDETLLIVVADHGEAFDEHPGNRSHSAFIYEENIRVPLGIHNPILFSGAPSVSRVTNHIDILPTIADLLALPPQSSWQGRSLLEDGRSRLIYFYSASGRQLVGLRDGRWKLIWNRTTRTTQLFDLEEDPGEQNDLSAAYAERIDPYHQILSQWRTYQLALIPRFGLQDEDSGARWVADLRSARRYQPHPYDPVADHTVAGRDLQVDWISYEHGLGTHADSWYTYDIGRLGARRLVGRVGRDRRMMMGELHAYLFLDGELAFDSGALVAGTPAMGFDLDVSDVEEVTFAAWTGADTGRSDHVNWADLRFITDDAEAFQPGSKVYIDELRPSGANRPGVKVRGIPTLPHERVRTAAARAERGLVVPGGSTVHYDLRPLGATKITGRLFSEGYGLGAPAELVELFFDADLAWQGRPNRMSEPHQAFELDVPAEARLFTIRTSETAEDAAEVVLADLEISSTPDALAAKRLQLRRSTPRVWSLAALPPAPPAPSAYQVGWSRAVDGSWLRLGGQEERVSFWQRSGSTLHYRLTRLGVRRVEGRVAVSGPAECRLTAVIRSGETEIWRSEPLTPATLPVTFDTVLEGGDELSLEARGGSVEASEECLLLWGRPMLHPLS